MVVIDQFWVILVGFAAQETVKTLKAAPQRPAVVRSCGGDLVSGGQVPFADCVGIVAVLQKHLGEEAVLKGDISVRPRVPGRSLSDASHSIGMVVAPGQDAGPGW